MPEKYTVKITTQAQEQLKEIIHYINYSLQAPGTAMKMLDTLEKEIASLDQFPNRGPLTEEEPWHSQGLRVLPVDNYLVFYLPDENSATVNIIRIMYGGRDIDKQLNES